MQPIPLDIKADADKAIVWANDRLYLLDQRILPGEEQYLELQSATATANAITDMVVRGAPAIGVTAAFGVVLAARASYEQNGSSWKQGMQRDMEILAASRPTAVNLFWALERMGNLIKELDAGDPEPRLLQEAQEIHKEDVASNRTLGDLGADLIDSKTSVITHCNAGALATVDYGTALAPMRIAHTDGKSFFVYADETRPRLQGLLTAWELHQEGIDNALIADNAAGYLMKNNDIDFVITGADRVTKNGDIANKIGTYLKALAAKDNDVPFYVALPSSTFDWTLRDGIKEIPIEERDPDEIRYIQGKEKGEIKQVLIPPEDSPCGNFAFDVTPARLVTGFITERGICDASETEIKKLFPEK